MTELYTEEINNNVMNDASSESFTELSEKKHNTPAVKVATTPDIPFWTENPNVLFQSQYITEFFPVDEMTYSQKLNAVTRIIILLGVLLTAYTRNMNVVIITAITIGAVALVYHNHKRENTRAKKVRFDLDEHVEPFMDKSDGLAKHTISQENVKLSPELFDSSTPHNPFSNVLLTDYENNPSKKPAPAAYNKFTSSDILGNAKELVRQSNPDQPDIADKLFKDLGEEFQFEQSMRPFYSTPSTTIPNDQQAFADFCYGSMISCKEGNMFACSRKYQMMPAV
jgi:hypothetical protein